MPTLAQTEGNPVSFDGELIASICSDKTGTKAGDQQHVIELYSVTGGGYVLAIEYKTTFVYDRSRRVVVPLPTEHDVWRYLAGYDGGQDVQFSGEQTMKRKAVAVRASLASKFADAARLVLAKLPSTAEHIVGQRWKCDTCGRGVPLHGGVVEWIENTRTNGGGGLRLVHADRKGQMSCSGNDEERHEHLAVMQERLQDCLGPDGLMRLVAMADQGVCPVSEVAELIKRLHVPRYEQARPYLEAAAQRGFPSDPEMPPGGYYQATLADIVHQFGQDKGSDEC